MFESQIHPDKIKEVRSEIHKIKSHQKFDEYLYEHCFEKYKKDTNEKVFELWLKDELRQRKEYLIRKEKYNLKFSKS